MGDIGGASYASGWGSWNVSQVQKEAACLILDEPGKRPSWPDVRHQQVKVYQKRDSVDPEVFGVRSTAMTLALGAARPMDASGPHAMTMLRTLRPSLMRFLFVKYLDFCSSFGKSSIYGENVFESQSVVLSLVLFTSLQN